MIISPILPVCIAASFRNARYFVIVNGWWQNVWGQQQWNNLWNALCFCQQKLEEVDANVLLYKLQHWRLVRRQFGAILSKYYCKCMNKAWEVRGNRTTSWRQLDILWSDKNWLQTKQQHVVETAWVSLLFVPLSLARNLCPAQFAIKSLLLCLHDVSFIVSCMKSLPLPWMKSLLLSLA